MACFRKTIRPGRTHICDLHACVHISLVHMYVLHIPLPAYAPQQRGQRQPMTLWP